MGRSAKIRHQRRRRGERSGHRVAELQLRQEREWQERRRLADEGARHTVAKLAAAATRPPARRGKVGGR